MPLRYHAAREILKEQLEHLTDLGHRPTVRIRVLRDGLGLHAGLDGAFVLATLNDGRPVGYLDDLLAGHVATAHGRPGRRRPSLGGGGWSAGSSQSANGGDTFTA